MKASDIKEQDVVYYSSHPLGTRAPYLVIGTEFEVSHDATLIHVQLKSHLGPITVTADDDKTFLTYEEYWGKLKTKYGPTNSGIHKGECLILTEDALVRKGHMENSSYVPQLFDFHITKEDVRKASIIMAFIGGRTFILKTRVGSQGEVGPCEPKKYNYK